MINALSFDIEDWFQVENLKSAISYGEWDNIELRICNNTEKILRLLKKRETTATFFILGWIADKCPSLIKEIAAQGHEIASHGYSHELVYDMEPDDFSEDIRRSKAVLEDLVNNQVTGYRAPSFSITKESLWALDILKKNGFKYDSSIFPLKFHDRYGFESCDTKPFSWPNGLIEVPLSVYKIGNVTLPLGGGGYFRLLPYAYFKYFFKKLNLADQGFTFYLHPWEFDPSQPRVHIPLFYRFRHYVNLKLTEGRLDKLLGDFKFDGISKAYRLNETN